MNMPTTNPARHPKCGHPYCACVGECFAASQPPQFQSITLHGFKAIPRASGGCEIQPTSLTLKIPRKQKERTA